MTILPFAREQPKLVLDAQPSLRSIQAEFGIWNLEFGNVLLACCRSITSWYSEVAQVIVVKDELDTSPVTIFLYDQRI